MQPHCLSLCNFQERDDRLSNKVFENGSIMCWMYVEHC